MSSFTEPLEYEALGTIAKISGLPQYKILKEFTFYVGKKGSDFQVVVPSGYITDFASIPKFATRWFKPEDSRWAKAALAHDYVCSTKRYSRCMCDLILLEAMLVLGTPMWIAQLFYRSVVVFGIYKALFKGEKFYVSQ